MSVHRKWNHLGEETIFFIFPGFSLFGIYQEIAMSFPTNSFCLPASLCHGNCQVIVVFIKTKWKQDNLIHCYKIILAIGSSSYKRTYPYMPYNLPTWETLLIGSLITFILENYTSWIKVYTRINLMLLAKTWPKIKIATYISFVDGFILTNILLNK